MDSHKCVSGVWGRGKGMRMVYVVWILESCPEMLTKLGSVETSWGVSVPLSVGRAVKSGHLMFKEVLVTC